MTQAGSPRVGVVFVSHSEKIADGLVELARQMAPNTTLVAAGGTDDGGIGTSLTKILQAVQSADAGAGAVVLCDLGSAIMTAESALDFLGPDAAQVRLVDAPLVEGGVAAAVAAESGGDVGAVVAAARSAVTGGDGGGASEGVGGDASAGGGEPGRDGGGGGGAAAASARGYSRNVTLVNRDGLHARPAAEFVKLANTLDARVTVNGKDAKSLLGIMSLGLTKGTTAEIASDEPGGEAAVDALASLIESGFGEGA
ncbi:dihydroxyacetone kinase phosphoryl donor subunit DhaM [Microbacterium sp. STN6]|uniref:dihydroxyacetone kinase phosphoryl donor subunit DhaM n=1 Tax=Microbacterium sp. STN6 TaxID=2995588 RepID=UPI0022609456|nr:dihydroxyacetone kinase phosphoryl donor subunit DhaM [Microbacterium sp. STN6]MCX7521541.1 dihydroxyacetone kinase phosphoryl donor subunit DhaM [Microbacterium sp. STN6]